MCPAQTEHVLELSRTAVGHMIADVPRIAAMALPKPVASLLSLEPITLPLVIGFGLWRELCVTGRGRTVTTDIHSKLEHRSTWIVIAAFNEAAVIGPIISDIVRRNYQVVVVDDGSHDGTEQIARSAGAAVVTHPVNLGQGAALQTGIKFALQQGACRIVTFDADGQHRASDIPRLLKALADHNASYALGSRFLGSSRGMPLARRLLLYAAIWFTRAVTGLRLTDTHNGLRAMTREGARRIALRQNRMAHASEILEQIAATGLPYVEVPVTIDYTQYSLAKGQSFADSLTILFDLSVQKLHR
jgi:polyprenyl-phospho-N-acetylgalactosaminyl synthase